MHNEKSCAPMHWAETITTAITEADIHRAEADTSTYISVPGATPKISSTKSDIGIGGNRIIEPAKTKKHEPAMPEPPKHSSRKTETKPHNITKYDNALDRW